MKTQIFNTKEDLIYYLAEGGKIKYVFFWGHTSKDESKVGKECFSQWYETEFTIDQNVYPTAEHYMMAEKARLFNDSKVLNSILKTRHPAEAKKLGRSVKGYDEKTWCENRFNIVIKANEAKFSQNPILGEYLINTRDRVLVEASPFDAIWGIGLDATRKDIENPGTWPGLNLLGFALMRVRERLIDHGE